ncbi:MAG: hypothetical protein AAFO01_11390 [Pseudomonadota bacterium]
MAESRAHAEQFHAFDKPWHEPGIEPALNDMLDDPIVQRLMNRDGVHRDDVERLIDRMRVRLLAARSHPVGKVA